MGGVVASGGQGLAVEGISRAVANCGGKCRYRNWWRFSQCGGSNNRATCGSFSHRNSVAPGAKVGNRAGSSSVAPEIGIARNGRRGIDLHGAGCTARAGRIRGREGECCTV